MAYRRCDQGGQVPMALSHQAAYGAPASPQQVSFSPAPAAVPVTIRAPPSSASPAPAPRQLAPAPASSAPSAAALAKEVDKKLFVSETALAPPAAAVAAAQGAAASDTEEASDVDLHLAPVSKKGLAHPARPGLGTVGKKVMIRANHFLVDVADNNLFHYDLYFWTGSYGSGAADQFPVSWKASSCAKDGNPAHQTAK